MRDLDALRNSHGRLPAVMRSRSSILITLDQNGIVLLWNSGAEQCFGRSEEQVMGRPFKHAGIRWDWERIAQVAPGGVCQHARRVVLPYSRPDGKLSVLAMQILPQFGPDGALTGCLWLGSDTGANTTKLASGPQPWQRPSMPTPAAVAPTAQSRTPGSTSGRSPVAASPPPSPASSTTRSFAPVPIGSLRTPPPGSAQEPVPTPLPSAAPVDPSKHFPIHLSFLDSHLVAQDDDLSNWRILHAKETRLDETGMEVLFTLSRRYPGQGIITRRILVVEGELVHVQDS